MFWWFEFWFEVWVVIRHGFRWHWQFSGIFLGYCGFSFGFGDFVVLLLILFV